jgi:NAD(P)-dependent dehydrogenase (short-subunit alcohol dehydrogenase family)
MSGRLAGKVALITGAGCVGPGWGNGRAAAVLFAQQGARIFAVDRHPDAQTATVARGGGRAPARPRGGLPPKPRPRIFAPPRPPPPIPKPGARGGDGDIATHVCDVLDDAQVRAMVEACRKAYGRIDILVNNVGGSAARGAAELSEEAWDRQLDYNLKSVFLTCRHVIPVMIEQGGGAIVNTASTSGLRYTGAPQVGYASAKAAIIQFSRVTAVQYAAHGIRVNTVVPGQMHTPMVEARLAKQRAGGDLEALLRQRVARIPLGFMGDGRDTANAALFLASDEARFITGTEIVVDGGMTARCD